jgi:hypothetical protein
MQLKLKLKWIEKKFEEELSKLILQKKIQQKCTIKLKEQKQLKLRQKKMKL